MDNQEVTNQYKRIAVLDWLGRFIFWGLGWSLEGQVPNNKKYVVIFAHHTSNWDFYLMMASKLVLRIRARWFAKHSLFIWPVSIILRSLGGIPINREEAKDIVATAVKAFSKHNHFVVGLAPEGTRNYVPTWKSGFHRIALGAGVPILPVALDFVNKKVVIGNLFHPTEDFESDLQKLLQYYKKYVPAFPERATMPNTNPIK
jgi:1-acyl-sn-glycerol-3-phosphate acyltransferase